MAIPNVILEDSFDVWRTKTNLIAQLEGDLTTLLTMDQTNLVAAINEVYNQILGENRRTLIRAIAMS